MTPLLIALCLAAWVVTAVATAPSVCWVICHHPPHEPLPGEWTTVPAALPTLLETR